MIINGWTHVMIQLCTYTIYFNIYTIIIKSTILILIKRLSHFVLKKQKERVTDSDQ